MDGSGGLVLLIVCQCNVAIITAERPAYELHDVVIREAAREYLSDTSHTGGLASRSLVA